MTEAEFASLLQHLMLSARASGLEDLSSRILADIRADPGSPSDQLFRYLDALILELRLGSDDGVRTVVQSLGELARTESGRPIEGIRLELADADASASGRDYLDLGLAPDLSNIIDRLDRLRSDLADSREN